MTRTMITKPKQDYPEHNVFRVVCKIKDWLWPQSSDQREGVRCICICVEFGLLFDISLMFLILFSIIAVPVSSSNMLYLIGVCESVVKADMAKETRLEQAIQHNATGVLGTTYNIDISWKSTRNL